MTYDVRRFDIYVDYETGASPDGKYVLAADAEAHEKAAVEAAREQGKWDSFSVQIAMPHMKKLMLNIREQAIRDCIESLEHMLDVDPCDCDRCRAYTTAQAIMRALLDNEQEN